MTINHDVKYMKHRNSEIDFFRLVFAFIVVVHHSHGLDPPDPVRYPFVGGYLPVEFFFLLSGYYSVRTCINNENIRYRSAIVWTRKKFARIFPYVVPAIVVHYVIRAFLFRFSFREGIKSLGYGVFEMLLLPSAGFYDTFQNASLWYLSALLIILPLFFSCLIRSRDFFLYIVCPLSALLIYGFFSVTLSHIDTWQNWEGLFYSSLLRAWAGLSLGGVVFLLSEALCTLSFSKTGYRFLSFIEIVALGIVFFYMFTRTHRKMDFLCIGLMAAAACIMLAEKSSIHRFFSTLFSKCSEYSLALYVSHWTVRMLIPFIMPEAAYQFKLLPYIALSAVYAGILTLCVTAVQKTQPLQKIIKHLIVS